LALVPTEAHAAAAQIVKRYASRWAIEVAFSDAKHITGSAKPGNRTAQLARGVDLCHRRMNAWILEDFIGALDGRSTRRRAAQCAGPIGSSPSGPEPLHHHDVDLLDVLQDEVHQIPGLAGAEVPAAQCSVGVVIGVWEPLHGVSSSTRATSA